MATDSRKLRELELIKKHTISKQDQLVELLNAEGFNVTQATVSRDINELNLKKQRNENGVLHYVVSESKSQETENLAHLFKRTVLSINYSINIIVVKTIVGSASAVCALIDKMNIGGILGTVAGDDCLFIVVADEMLAPEISDKLSAFLEN